MGVQISAMHDWAWIVVVIGAFFLLWPEGGARVLELRLRMHPAYRRTKRDEKDGLSGQLRLVSRVIGVIFLVLGLIILLMA
ncbi:MAG: hypothetical protein ABIH41_06730 [Nanoarchaeota archaeon]